MLALAFEALAHHPRRVGKPLTNELAGLRSARRSDYRVIYEIDAEARVVVIRRAAPRRDRIRLPRPGGGDPPLPSRSVGAGRRSWEGA